MFEVVIVDEAHFSAAPKFLGVIGKLNSRWFRMLTATPDRKDGKWKLIPEVIGPVDHEVKVDRLKPIVRLTVTKYKKVVKGRNSRWTTIVSNLENDKKRLELIAARAVKDVSNGHMILIPFSQIKPINKLVQLINERAGRNIAHAFTGSQAKIRDELVQKAREYKIKVLVGQLKILSTGINIPRASMLYEVMLSSNMVNAEQRMMRILTAHEGKPSPAIRFFLDDFSIRRNCMRNEVFNVLYPKLKPIISEKTKELFDAYLKGKTNVRAEL
jgi:superfamily II DNA or RNA helicase